MNKSRIVLCSLLSGLALAAHAAAPASAETAPGAMTPQHQRDSKASQEFAKKAMEGNLTEIELGKLAADHTNNQAVKDYGQMLVTDHTAANDKLKSATQGMNGSMPSAPTAKQKATIARFAKLNGEAFDRQFAQHMVMDHKEDIAEFTREAKMNDALGAYAKAALPTLQMHLDKAKSLKSTTVGSR